MYLTSPPKNVADSLLRLVAHDQVPAGVWRLRLLLHVLVAGQLVETGDDQVGLQEPVAGAGGFELVVVQDLERKLEPAVELVLPLSFTHEHRRGFPPDGHVGHENFAARLLIGRGPCVLRSASMSNSTSETWTIIGTIASVVVVVRLFGADLKRLCDKRKVLAWLRKNTKDAGSDFQYRSTRAIASGTNLSEDRVREICSNHKRIHLSTGEKSDRWGLK